ncbi:Z1 domain-containing protein [Alkalibacillus haloalkaliphilus]|uniref:Endonuclease n=1 Tax=Alkalibacillus haloalkaliphilus TaxID=94136 RepID=A0A511W6L4_9BACI|nr:Z1 domain-containing protein [Alkalibacillus haloalkaliphilus]GEN46739.1 endonuclease [Alkalibacillus haloalkaliphilus]
MSNETLKVQDLDFTEEALRILPVVMKSYRKNNNMINMRDKKEILLKVNHMVKAIDKHADYDQELLEKRLEYDMSIFIDDKERVIQGKSSKKKKPWLNEEISNIKWHFWERYETYLEQVKKMPSLVISSLDSSTNRVLDMMGNPKGEDFKDVFGVVSGKVQVGKTTHYTGLVCKSVDAGAKLVIVLGGHDEGLRTQTQKRIDEGFLGEYVLEEQYSDQGSICVLGDTYNLPTVHSLTGKEYQEDFNRILSDTNIKVGGDTILLVVKKNDSILKNVLSWLKRNAKTDSETGQLYIDDVPAVILDDECDFYTANTGKNNEVKAINGNVRKIMKLFRKNAYIGYTATPYANVFAKKETDEQNLEEFGLSLFPKDFIVNMPTPTNYYGPSKIFGLESDDELGLEHKDSLPIIRRVTDTEDIIPSPHKINLEINELPNSLREAIQMFILVCCVRKARKQEKSHNSMLVHVSRFKDVQCDVADLIDDELRNIKNALKDQDDPIYEIFKELYFSDIVNTTKETVEMVRDKKITGTSWYDVKEMLLEEVQIIEVRTVNSKRREYLNYDDYSENGLNVIAVGGDLLSRGLTLEGLSISYLLRGTSAGDTLVQMGRFFGYKDGFIDLCRLYTTEDLVNAYIHMAKIEEEMKQEFAIMNARGKTPQEYGLKVRTHPEGLHVTSPNKKRNSTELTVNFSGKLAAHTFMYKNKEIIANNYMMFEKWIDSLGAPDSKRTLQWGGISADKVVELIMSFINHPYSVNTHPEALSSYIEQQVNLGRLTNWTVQIMSSSQKKIKIKLGGEGVTKYRVFHNIAGHKVGMVIRKDASPTNPTYFQIEKAHLISKRHESMDMEVYYPEHYTQALNEYREHMRENKNSDPTKIYYPAGPFVRYNRPDKAGFLMIYIIDPAYVVPGECKPIVSYAISFPETETAESVKYLANDTYLANLYDEK